MANEYTVVVAVRATPAGKEFLMVHNPERGWELPGGKIESGEGPVHCALREFREETSHLLAQPRFVTKLHKANGTCYVFTGGFGPEAHGRPGDEPIDGMRWFRSLPERSQLAFPDDPYEEIGRHLDLDFGAS